MFMWFYDIWKAIRHKITPLRQLELDIIDFKKTINEKDKQINNIYEILETLTNESKTKYLNESNNVQQVSI